MYNFNFFQIQNIFDDILWRFSFFYFLFYVFFTSATP